MNQYMEQFLHYYIMSFLMLMTGAAIVCSSTDQQGAPDFMGSGAIELHKEEVAHAPMPAHMPEPPVPHEEQHAEHMVPAEPEHEQAHEQAPVMEPSHDLLTTTSATAMSIADQEKDDMMDEPHEKIYEEIRTVKRKIKSLKRFIAYEFKHLARKIDALHGTNKL